MLHGASSSSATAAASASYRSANEARRERMAIQHAEQQLQLFHKQRHDILVSAIGQRNPIAREENELREHYFHNFRRSVVEIQNWQSRRTKQTARHNARHEKLSANVARVVNMTIDDIDASLEFEARRQIDVLEEKCRRMIWRVMAHDSYLLECQMQQRRLIRAEDRIRETYSNEERKLRDEIETAYNCKPWQPHSLLYGVCPFSKKSDCPFFKEKKQRLLPFPVSPDHFVFSM